MASRKISSLLSHIFSVACLPRLLRHFGPGLQTSSNDPQYSRYCIEQRKGNFHNSVRGLRTTTISMDSFQLSPNAGNVSSMPTLCAPQAGALPYPYQAESIYVSVPVHTPRDRDDDVSALNKSAPTRESPSKRKGCVHSRPSGQWSSQKRRNP